MRYYIYDQKGIKLGLLQNHTSIQWKPRYNRSGTCEIHARPTKENVDLLKKWNRIVCAERNEILFISYVKRNDDELVIKGYLDNLDQRINTQTQTIKDIEKDLYKLVNDNKRGLDINTQPTKQLQASLQVGSQTTYNTLRKDFEKYCQASGLGWRESVINNKLNCLEIYQGQSKKNARLSDQIGSVLNQEYEESMNKYFNVAYVYGESKDNVPRKSVTIEAIQEGEPRIEKYIDARDIQSTYKDSHGTEQTYSDSDYKKLLTDRGNAKLSEARMESYSLKFELDPKNQIAELGIDYNLGDVVPVLSTKFNLFVHARITGIDIVEEDNELKTLLEVTIENMKGVSL